MSLDTIQTSLRLLRDDSAEGARARRRAAAISAMSLFMFTWLAIIGLAAVVITAILLVAAGATLVALAQAVRNAKVRGLTPLRGQTPAVHVRSALQLARNAKFGGLTPLRGQTPAVHLRSALRLARQATARALTQLRGLTPAVRRDPQSEAVKLNAHGSDLRRQGRFAEAAEQHRAALSLFRELGDARAEALTLNNLALALDRAGDPSAIELFEQAATMLGELGDEQREGQVIANLAVAFRRHGSEQRFEGALDAALEKLHPQTKAYRQVEQLRRAS